MKDKAKYILFAVMAAVFYALNIPFSKYLLGGIGSTILAGLLYLGAGLGVGIIFLCNRKKIVKEELLDRHDLPYTILMVALDIAAPILLMYGLSLTTAGNASLLNSFEIVVTSVIALVVFKELISWKLWIAIVLVTVSSFLLSFEDISSFTFSTGSIFVLAATLCWGIENNCTKKISGKSTFEIVTIKGLGSGIGSLAIGLIIKETVTVWWYIPIAVVLGFVAYGLSIYFYIKAQSGIGAAKTSAFYAVNPFISALISVLLFKETLKWNYYVALAVMLVGTGMIIFDTLSVRDNSEHTHVITHTHDGTTHTHVITHSHSHVHVGNMEWHIHDHKKLLKEIGHK